MGQIFFSAHFCFFWKSVEDGLTYHAPEEVYRSQFDKMRPNLTKSKQILDSRERNTTSNSLLASKSLLAFFK